MAHKGRPGPWAPFRDLIGAKPWTRRRQPPKFARIYGLQGAGTLSSNAFGGGVVSDEIEYDPGDDMFAYAWEYPTAAHGGPATLRLEFRYPDDAKYMTVDCVVDGPNIHAEATIRTPDYEGYGWTSIDEGDFFTIVAGSSTSDPEVWRWGYLGSSTRCVLRMNTCPWASLP